MRNVGRAAVRPAAAMTPQRSQPRQSARSPSPPPATVMLRPGAVELPQAARAVPLAAVAHSLQVSDGEYLFYSVRTNECFRPTGGVRGVVVSGVRQ